MQEDLTSAKDATAYVGGELELFQHAVTWKRYWFSKLEGFITGDVLEVGAGIGANVALITKRAKTYTGLEPDPDLCKQLASACKSEVASSHFQGTLGCLETDSTFDTIIYIDVLEHIRDDAQELHNASQALRSGGRIIILCPAYQFLFSPFDASIGHFRRYDKHTLGRITPTNCSIEKAFYLDSVGCVASLVNKYILRSPLPTLKQVNFWDRVIVPISRIIDKLSGYSFGKSIVHVLTVRDD